MWSARDPPSILILHGLSSTYWFALRLIPSYARQYNGRTVGEFSHQRQASPHPFHGLPESGNQQIGAFFELGNAILADAQSLGHAYLRELARAPEFLQGHFLGDELSRAGLHLLATGRA